MRKPASNSLPVVIRFKPEADRHMAAEVDLLLSVLPQLLAAISAEAQVNNASNSEEKLSFQQNNNLPLDNDVTAAEYMR